MIVIVDYGMGNLGSILNMLKKIGAQVIISSKHDEIEKADKLILPGVGAFDNGMKNLSDLGLISVLKSKVIDQRTPVLGVCLGMQLLGKRSEEGQLSGLGWLDAETLRFNFHGTNANLKVPHMGWNQINVHKKHPMFYNLEVVNRFYFVHSYYVVCANPDNVLASTTYGFNFTSAIIKDNIMGVQFHPEKSHTFGMRLLKNFVEGVWC
jgi:imidazole glycerol phosphate synthase, glutamine amidotransferase subunit